MRQIIKKYTDAKIVVMIEWHEVGGLFTDIGCASNWWVMLAKEYKNNPYVWFDLYNEPQVSSNDTWKNSLQVVANAIRATGNTNIIVATGNWWGQDANDWNCANVSESKSAILSQSLTDPVNNTVYSIHIYDQWKQCQSKLDNYFDRVIQQNKCILVGEYGVYNNSDVSIAVDYTLAAVQPRNIGRIAWAWWGGDKNDLTTGGNGGGPHTQYDANGTATNLTDFGTKVWTDLNRTEKLGDIPAGCR
ncbi:MAG: glycoside hydrolase family 5 protein [Bacteroidales bacterium]|nr:glycoside hydrolase family 5 protein [Bacteroidales bacterium]